MITLFFAAGDDNWNQYEGPLILALEKAKISATILTKSPANPETVDYIIYAPVAGALTDFTPYRNVRAVLSLWAGVEKLAPNKTLRQPLCRMVDPGLTEGMVEYVAGHVLRQHLGIDRYIINPNHDWVQKCPPLARERSVGIMGLGTLGTAVTTALRALNFNLSAWGRSPKPDLEMPYFHGSDGLEALLSRSEILVTLLPDTPDTRGLLNAQTIAYLPYGAALINPGRGTLIDDVALLAALDQGALSHATLDVFHQEPLPKTHRFWQHPKVTVTPHIAADTRPLTSSRVVVENIRRDQAGLALLHQVDLARGY
ncbi:MAG: glyoxylate/hydroxypyruvate reductase A [Paracoccaceae bacterium]|jgi:glyoxylate/hydroxypyruvate reductase|nr:glyoxylate/hydroxypyruvate reductase A [Paracoccaceae bacterium]